MKELKSSGFLLWFHVCDEYWVIYTGCKIFILAISSLYYQILGLPAINFLVWIFSFIVHVLVAPSLGIRDTKLNQNFHAKK